MPACFLRAWLWSFACERWISARVCACVCARLCVFVCLLPLCLFSKVQQRGSSDQHHLTDGGGERFPWQPGALVSGGGWSVQPWELCHQHKLVCQRHHLHVQTRCSITMSSALLPFKFLASTLSFYNQQLATRLFMSHVKTWLLFWFKSETLTCVSLILHRWRFTALSKHLSAFINSFTYRSDATSLHNQTNGQWGGEKMLFIYTKHATFDWLVKCLNNCWGKAEKKWKRGQRWEEEKMRVEWRSHSWEQFLLMSSL